MEEGRCGGGVGVCGVGPCCGVLCCEGMFERSIYKHGLWEVSGLGVITRVGGGRQAIAEQVCKRLQSCAETTEALHRGTRALHA